MGYTKPYHKNEEINTSIQRVLEDLYKGPTSNLKSFTWEETEDFYDN